MRWKSLKHPFSDSRTSFSFLRNLPRTFQLSNSGESSPAIIASMIRRPLTPIRSVATEDNFKLAVSNKSRIWLCTSPRSCSKLRRWRSICRNSRISCGGTKLASSRLSCRYSAMRRASRWSLLRPCRALTCAGFTSSSRNPCPSSTDRYKAGVQPVIVQILGDAPRVPLVALAPLQGLDLRRIHQQQPESVPLQYVPYRAPVDARRFHGDFGHLQHLQPTAHARQIVPKCAIALLHARACLPIRCEYANHNRVLVDVHSAAAAIYCV